MTLACVLLAASGGVRIWQGRRLEAASQGARVTPFALKDLPSTLGRWHLREHLHIEPDQLQIAGSTDYVARTYVDELTGVTLTVLVAFGPAERVFAHTAEVCFPAIGYALAEGAEGHEVANDPGPARFRSLVYAKNQGGTIDRQEVYYSFRHADRWAPDEAGRRKLFRRSPAMFKVQVQRQVAPGERRGSDSPCEQFLGVLLPEIERLLAKSAGSRAA